METSLFIRLSSEVRNEIWSDVFTSPYAVKLQNDTLQHPLTQTCRQIRHETLAMFYALTRFNAHLDDGPATPLLKWFRKLDPENMLVINEINLWDLHNLNGTFYGSESAHALLKKGPEGTGKKYILKPAEDWIFAQHGLRKTLKDIVMALHDVGFGLLRFCVVDCEYDEIDPFDEDNHEMDKDPANSTSSFALVRLDSKPAGQIFTDCATNIDWLAQDCDLSEYARIELIRGLADGQIIVEVLNGAKRIVFDFTSLELGGRIKEVEDAGGGLATIKDRRDNLAQAVFLLGRNCLYSDTDD